MGFISKPAIHSRAMSAIALFLRFFGGSNPFQWILLALSCHKICLLTLSCNNKVGPVLQLDMTPSPILHLEDLSKRFANLETPAVDGVSLSLEAGEILALLGPSGCGKTTLLRLIAGFEQPTGGNLELAGRSVAHRGGYIPPEQRSVGMVFQDFALFPHLTVAENIAFGLSLPRHSPALQKQVAEAIALVNLQGKEHRYPHELSGGQQQRVALARALAPRPTLVLLDEPLSNLDVQVRLYLRQEVREILKETGTAAVFVTHDQEEAMAIADRVAVMRQGRLEQLGSPEQIYGQPQSRFVAEFVTQSNFFPAQRQGQVWQTEIGLFSAEQVPAAASEQATGALMVRQEDLRLTADPQGVGVVRDRQFLGREYRYCVGLASGLRCYARTSTQTVIGVGTTVRLDVAAPQLQVF